MMDTLLKFPSGNFRSCCCLGAIVMQLKGTSVMKGLEPVTEDYELAQLLT